MHRKLIVTATAVAALGMAAPAAQAAFPGQNGQILFGNSFEDGSGIFSTSLGGTASLLFETDGVGAPDGVDTADGKRIVFNDSDFSIWVANADGSAKTRLTPEGIEDFGPSWSPDGTKIVFASRPVEAAEDFSLWTMNADGSDRRQLGEEDDPIYGFQPAWSPDGKSIAFTEYGYYVYRGRGYSAIAITDPAGANGVDYLTEGTDPEWAPDGRSIVHIDNLFSFGELYRYDLETNDGERLTDPEDDLRYRGPSISPDGKKIAAETELYDAQPARGESIFYDISTLNADGSGTTVLAGTRGGGGAEWSIAPAKAAPAPEPQVQQQPPTPQVQQQARVTAPSQARVCGSRRFFNITVVNKGLKKVSVTVNGKKVTAKRKGRGFSARVDLRKLPKGRFTVKIRKTLKSGTVKHETRRYRTCVAKGRS